MIGKISFLNDTEEVLFFDFPLESFFSVCNVNPHSPIRTTVTRRLIRRCEVIVNLLYDIPTVQNQRCICTNPTSLLTLGCSMTNRYWGRSSTNDAGKNSNPTVARFSVFKFGCGIDASSGTPC